MATRSLRPKSCHWIKAPVRRPVLISNTDVKRGVEYALRSGLQHSALCLALQYECFVRASELVGENPITFEQVSFDGPRIALRDRSDQWIDLNECELVMQAFRAFEAAKLTGPIARRPDGRPWSDSRSYFHHVRQLMADAGAPGISAHDLRYSGLVNLMQSRPLLTLEKCRSRVSRRRVRRR